MSYTIDENVRAALFDIDGTLTTGGEVWEPLTKSPDVSRFRKTLLYARVLPHYLLINAGAASQAGFRDRWVRRMAGLMAGWRKEQVEAVFARIIGDYLVPTLRPDVVAILKQHTAAGQPVILVSTMLDGIVSGLAKHLEVTAGLGSRLEIRGGMCTGRVLGPTCAGARKIEFAQQYLGEHDPDLSLKMCAAYADSQSDIPLLAGVGYPVAVYPDDVMRTAALQHGWRIFS